MPTILRVCIVAVVVACGRLLVAQFPPDMWLVNEYSMGCRVWSVGSSTYATGMGFAAPQYSSTVTDAGSGHTLFFEGMNLVLVFDVDQVTLGAAQRWASQPIGSWKLSSFSSVPYLAVTRDRVWIMAPDGRLGWFDKFTGGAQPNLVGNVRTILGLNDPYEEITSVCTNGRELFFSVGVTATNPWHVFAVDLESTPLHAWPIAQMSRAASMTVPRRGATLCIGTDGKLIALDDSLLLIDPLTGLMQQISGPYWQPLPYQPYPQNAVPLAYNAWDGTAIAVPPSPRSIFHWSGSTWTQRVTGWLTPLGPCHTTSPAPFRLFGKGCTNALNKEPRLGWRDLPRQGQTFSVTVRDAEPNGFAMIWLGWSDTVWAPVGALPFDAAPFGAPGCKLRISPDAPLPFFTDANGGVTWPIGLPTNSALFGMEVFAQSVSSAGANAFGFAASDAMVIRLR